MEFKKTNNNLEFMINFTETSMSIIETPRTLIELAPIERLSPIGINILRTLSFIIYNDGMQTSVLEVIASELHKYLDSCILSKKPKGFFEYFENLCTFFEKSHQYFLILLDSGEYIDNKITTAIIDYLVSITIDFNDIKNGNKKSSTVFTFEANDIEGYFTPKTISVPEDDISYSVLSKTAFNRILYGLSQNDDDYNRILSGKSNINPKYDIYIIKYSFYYDELIRRLSTIRASVSPFNIFKDEIMAVRSINKMVDFIFVDDIFKLSKLKKLHLFEILQNINYSMPDYSISTKFIEVSDRDIDNDITNQYLYGDNEIYDFENYDELTRDGLCELILNDGEINDFTSEIIKQVEVFLTDKHVAIIETYTTDSLLTAMYLEITKLIKNEMTIKKCKNCDRYFIPSTRSDEIYCQYETTSGRSCKEVGYENKVAANEILKAYRTSYKTHNAYVHRNISNKPYLMERFKKWSIEARKLKEKCQNKEISLQDFKTWLSKKNWVEDYK